MNRIRTVLAAVAAIHFASVTAWGCPLCFGITHLEPTLADEVRESRDIIAVASVTGKPGTFEIQSVLKGDAALKGNRVNAPDVKEARSLILCRDAANKPWCSLGSSGVQVEGFINVVLDLPATQPANVQEWNERLAHFRPYLENPDLRIALSALTEWARAPYSVLTAQHVNGQKLGIWLMNPARADAQEMVNVVRDAFGRTNETRSINEYVKARRSVSGLAPQAP